MSTSWFASTFLNISRTAICLGTLTMASIGYVLEAAAPRETGNAIRKIGCGCGGTPTTSQGISLASRHASAETPRRLADFNAETDPCQTPSPTCVIPAALTVLAGQSRVAVENGTMTAITQRRPLSQWAQASADRDPLSERDQEWLRRMNAPVLPGHCLLSAVRFLGPVSVDDLEQRYSWTIDTTTNQESGATILTAIPRDDAELLFAKSWRITVTQSGTGVVEVTQLAMLTRQGEWMSIQLPQPLPSQESPAIQLVNYEIPPSPTNHDPVPPPASVIRFATSTVEVELE